MYHFFKAIIKFIVPRRWLSAIEPCLRNLVSIPYVGNQYQCNLCHFRMSQFVKKANGQLLCPRCGSLPRTRRLFQVLTTQFDLTDKTVLHFSPPKSLSIRLNQLGLRQYITSDLAGEFKAQKKIDITAISEENNTFDLILCYHILEHVDQDEKALKELFRVLKPNGSVLIQSPFKEGEIYENSKVVKPKDRLRHFGQKDHVRIYSVNGLVSRLELAGFKVEVMTWSAFGSNPHEFKSKETALLASKVN
jgi:SAM-dependent methyltransferase